MELAEASSAIIPQDRIEKSILVIRGRQVMLDSGTVGTLGEKIETLENQMSELFSHFNAQKEIPSEKLINNGCVWDAYSYFAALIRSAKQSVTLIDNYCDATPSAAAILTGFTPEEVMEKVK